MAEGLGDVALADPDGAVQHDRFAGGDEAQGGQVAEAGGGDLGVVGEVEVLQRGGVFEAGGAEASIEGGGVAAGDLVFAQALEELEVAELAGVGLGQASVEVVEHPGQVEGAEAVVELMGAGHDAAPLAPNRRAGPWRWAGATGTTARAG